MHVFQVLNNSPEHLSAGIRGFLFQCAAAYSKLSVRIRAIRMLTPRPLEYLVEVSEHKDLGKSDLGNHSASDRSDHIKPCCNRRTHALALLFRRADICVYHLIYNYDWFFLGERLTSKQTYECKRVFTACIL